MYKYARVYVRLDTFESRGQRKILDVLLYGSLLESLETGSLTEPKSLPFGLRWPATELLGSACLCPLRSGLQAHADLAQFLQGLLNLGFHAYTTNTLTTEPPILPRHLTLF